MDKVKDLLATFEITNFIVDAIAILRDPHAVEHVYLCIVREA